MSATDSDNSIDWLASDDDDNESEREPDCTRRAGHAQAPNDTPSPGSPQRPHPLENSCSSSSSSTGMGEGIGSEVSKASSGCTGASDGNVCGVCPPGRPEKSGGRSDPQSLKRPRSPVAEQRKEREFTSQECEKDQLFTRKCMELQCYIHPLSLILNGLRSGRYRERLSSFQESVAMDRIQRIMGVLQNPCMGERYVNIILKMEDMLKSWFPNVKPQGHLGASQTEEATPTKKLKIAPVVTTALTVATANPVTVSAAPPHGTKALSVTDLTPPGAYSASNLKWLHTSPICSPTAEQAQAGPRHLPQPPPPPPPAADRTQTQDNAVSSTTDHSSTKTDSIPRGPPPLGKINAPCLERLLRSTESIISCRGVGGVTGSGWS